MRRRSGIRNSGDLPTQLLRSAPRTVRPSSGGIALLIGITALAIGGCFGAFALYGRAVAAERQAALFASDAVTVAGEVVRVQRRGDGDDRRSVVEYRYLAGSHELAGTATLRGEDHDRHRVGSRVDVHYLRSEPGSSWMADDRPRRQPFWPVVLLPAGCLVAVLGVARLMSRQADLLANGRFAHATVTKVVKKLGEHGTTWRVTYQWQLLSGAVRSAGYDAATKQPPAVGTLIPLLYDRDEPTRKQIYPFTLVKLKTNS